MRPFNQKSDSGYARKIIILNPDSPDELGILVGRGSGFTWNQGISVNGVDEINQTEVTEINFGRFELGTGNITVVDVPDVNDLTPVADDPTTIGPYVILDVVADQRPYAGAIRNGFEGVYFTGVSGGPSATPGTIMETLTVTFVRRLPGRQFCEKYGIAYPPEAA